MGERFCVQQSSALVCAVHYVLMDNPAQDHVHGYSRTNYERLNYLYSKYHSKGLEVGIASVVDD